MAKMNSVEMNTAVKEQALTLVNLPTDAVQIDAFEYAIPVVVEGETRYAKIAITAAIAKATKTVAAFDPDVAHAAYLEKLDERATREAEKAAKKAEKEVKATTKKA